jgi:hypothetical protein
MLLLEDAILIRLRPEFMTDSTRDEDQVPLRSYLLVKV